MRKFFKFIFLTVGIIAALLVVLLVGAGIYISIYYPPAKLKTMATDKLSEMLKRKVTIGDVHFNVLNGFEVTDLHIGNRPGWLDQEFLAAKDISISYHLFPLFWGQISLGEIKLNEPQILVERRGLKEFNFSDMAGSASAAALRPETTSPFSLISPAEAAVPPASGVTSSTQPSKTALLFSIDSVSISHGKMVYMDETTAPAQRSDLADLNFEVKNISLIGGKSTFTLNTPFSYNKMAYGLALSGSYRYFLPSQSIKELSIKGTVNDLGFAISGDALNMVEDFSPNMDGTASLDMLKFSGLVPENLSAMPKGLTLTGSARVNFHLSGSIKQGLELKGTADASDLSIQYQDMFIKAAKDTCKVDFDAVNSSDAYNLKNFHLVYQDWAVDGSFLYKNGISYSGEVHSKDLPLAGLSNDVPRLKKVKIDGTVAMNFTYSQVLNKPASFKTNGQVVVKGVGISLPNEPYLQNLNSVIDVTQSTVKIQNATFNGFDGSGAASLALTMGKTLGYSYAFDLKNVNAQKAINSSVDAYVTLNPAKYKDKLYGNMNFAYKGTGHGTTAVEAMSSAEGSGNYSITNGKVKGYDAISYINNFFSQKSDEINMETISGNIALKNKIATYTVNTTGKVGTVKAQGAVNVATYFYAPEMKVQCEIHKEFLDSDAIKAKLPEDIRNKLGNNFDIGKAADSNGNVPIDFRFTGDATKVPGLECVDFTRAGNNLLSSYASDLENAAEETAKNLVGGDAVQKGQNLLKGLFGH